MCCDHAGRRSWGKLSVGRVQDLVDSGCQPGDSRLGNVEAALVLEAEFVGPLPASTRPCASRTISMDRRPPGMSGPTQAGKGETLSQHACSCFIPFSS